MADEKYFHSSLNVCVDSEMLQHRSRGNKTYICAVMRTEFHCIIDLICMHACAHTINVSSVECRVWMKMCSTTPCTMRESCLGSIVATYGTRVVRPIAIFHIRCGAQIDRIIIFFRVCSSLSPDKIHVPYEVT